MNKNIYLNLALIACMGVTSSPLLAQIPPAPEHPANISVPAESTVSPTEAAALHTEQAAYHKAMAEHYKSLIAAEYAKGGDSALNKHNETIAVLHEALSSEHQRTAITFKTMTTTK